jgi:hypothetical protein
MDFLNMMSSFLCGPLGHGVFRVSDPGRCRTIADRRIKLGFRLSRASLVPSGGLRPDEMKLGVHLQEIIRRFVDDRFL